MANVWIQAARPKTLFVSISPVITAIAIALGNGLSFPILPAIICALFAIMAQIISNFVNDYADFIKGADDDKRLGPKRMLASGLISKKSMLIALAFTSLLTSLLGLSLIYWGGWILLPIGVIIFAGAYSYSAGPFPLSYHGMGDLAVVLFYGIVPVVFTYYVICNEINLIICLAGLAMGLVADELLIINNYRDAEQDKLHNKKTTVVIFGKRFAELMFLVNPILAFCIGYIFIANRLIWSITGIIFILVAFKIWQKMKKTEGAELNKLLGKASMLSILFATIVLISSVTA